MGKDEEKKGGMGGLAVRVLKVRDQGGSAMVVIPRAFQDIVGLGVGDYARVELATEGGKLFLKITKAE